MRDGEQDTSEYVVHGDELKKVVRLGRRRPMPFAFCPSLADDISLFATHRKRKPEMIARATRRDSGQTKVAFGTFVITGKTMVLTCTKELPAIAKKLKKHMRSERLPLNIRVLDQLGREIEADIDDDDDGEDIWGPDDDDDDDAPARRSRKPKARARGDRFGARVAVIRPPILAAGGTRGDRLRDLLSAALQAHEDGHRDKAESLVTRLEDEVRALMNSSDRPQVAMPNPATAARARVRSDDEDADDDDDDEEYDDAEEQDDDEAMEEGAAPEPAAPRRPAGRTPREDPAGALRLARRLSALRHRAAAIEGEPARRILAALTLAARALRSGDVDSAEEAAARIEPALARVEAQAASQGVSSS
ncbi:MAG: hypothetical protein KF887_04425 [Paracoccaceae bacterium]|nr:MAG: hypothetical protein KF887_04425 [Paracoccaceae bacterium]